MSDRIRVLRITPHLFRPGVWPVAFDPVGGLQVQVWRISEELAEFDVAQTVLTTCIPGCPRTSIPRDTLRVECPGIPLPEFAAGSFLGITWFLAVARRLIAMRSSFDLVHIHYNHWIWCRILTHLSRFLRIPTIVSLNTEIWVSAWFRPLVTGKYFNIARWIERRAVDSSDTVIVLTERDATRWSTGLKTDPGCVQVIPDSIDPVHFGRKADIETLCRFRKRFSLPEGAQVVVYVGRIRSEKGWEDLPGLAIRLRRSNAFLLICGDGPDRKRLERRMNESGCDGNWAITGFLEPEEIRVALQIADVLVLPSRREAFGSVLLEAMASGLPAVAYASGGAIDAAGNPPAIRLVSPGDLSELAEAVIQFLEDKRVREQFQSPGHVQGIIATLSTAG